MTYTQLCLVAVPLAVLLDLVVLRTRLLTRKVFWVSYAIMLCFQLLTNGWLTGRGVVRYDGAAILGGPQPVALGAWRVLYAPVEDIAFGFSLILTTLGLVGLLGAAGRGATPAPSGPDARRQPPER